MPGFHIYFSSRTEKLLDELIPLISERKSPFVREQVAVQSRGMERYLSMEIARRSGIAANISFPFPSHIWNTLLKEASGKSDIIHYSFPFNQLKLRKGIYSILSGDDVSEYPVLKNYLQHDDENIAQIKRFQLSQRISELYDRYAVQRPAMMKKWRESNYRPDDDDEKWQRRIYLELLDRGVIENFLEPVEKLHAAVHKKNGTVNFPDRIFIFGISTMPLLYREIIEILSLVSDIYIFNLNPLRDHKTSAGDELFHGLDDYLLSGGMEYFEYLNSLPGRFENAAINFLNDETVAKNLLGFLQDSLYRKYDKNILKFPANDLSLTVHSCHTPLREIEALRNYLIRQFSEKGRFNASDVIVMVKDIDRYAPFIHSVFGAALDEYKFDYSISDRHPVNEFAAWELLDLFFELSAGRFTAGDILSLCDSSLVKKHFNFSDEDRAIFEEWMHNAEIRWGYDGKIKCEYGLLQTDANTWKAGLDKLMLGFLIPDSPMDFSGGILPVQGVDSNTFEVFGRFIDFVEMTEKYRERFNKKWNFAEWKINIVNFFDDLTGSVPDGFEFLKTLEMWDEPDGKVPEKFASSMIRNELKEMFSERRFAYEFLSGGITFCSLTPMRSIPRKIIAVLGLDESSFPSSDRHASFDLLAKKSVRTDISRKNDDKQLFLEILLCAEESLYLSYTGRDISNNSIIRPSAVIKQLLNEIRNLYCDDNTSLDNIFFNHHLYQFHPEYFMNRESLKYNYSGYEFRKAASLLSEKKPGYRFLPDNFLVSENEKIKEIDISSFIRFFLNPCEEYLKQLYIFPGREKKELYDDEIFVPDGLENFRILKDIFEASLETQYASDKDLLFNFMKSRGNIPHGNPGRVYVELREKELREYASYIRELMKSSEKRSVSGSMDFFNLRLLMDENILQKGDTVHMFRPSSIKIKDLLKAWIFHVFIIAMEKKAVKTKVTGLKHGIIEHAVFGPVDGAREIIEKMIEYYMRGMKKPLPFFLESSSEYVRKILEKNDAEEAMKSALGKWNGNSFRKIEGEKYDPSVALCFGDAKLNEISEFQKVSTELLGEMLSGMTKV